MSETNDARRRVVAVAEAVLSGRVGVIEGARQLVALRSSVTNNDLDDDFIAFIAIDSETDTLPVGEVRKLWAADSLIAKDREIEGTEELYRDGAVEACRRLVARFGREV